MYIYHLYLCMYFNHLYLFIYGYHLYLCMYFYNLYLEVSSEVAAEQGDLTARKVGEVVTTTFSAVASALDYPLGILIILNK